jgi:formamidopyrimidine-DNA glycosylase
MPELPEVEFPRRQLARRLIGRTVAEVTTTRQSYFFLTPPRLLRQRLPGRTIEGLDRVGKYLLARFDSGERLLLHLGMTGQLFVSGSAGVRLLSAERGTSLPPELQRRGFRPDAHTHLRLSFADGGPHLFFRDVRKFGKVQLLASGESSPRLDRLGVDALRARASDLATAARRRSAAVKTLLLDQSVVAGVGNIYADEALFVARIKPTRPARRLSPAECKRLLAAVRRVLQNAVANGDAEITPRVYGRTGAPCRRCGAPIARRILGGRSSHYCPRCQR